MFLHASTQNTNFLGLICRSLGIRSLRLFIHVALPQETKHILASKLAEYACFLGLICSSCTL